MGSRLRERPRRLVFGTSLSPLSIARIASPAVFERARATGRRTCADVAQPTARRGHGGQVAGDRATRGLVGHDAAPQLTRGAAVGSGGEVLRRHVRQAAAGQGHIAVAQLLQGQRDLSIRESTLSDGLIFPSPMRMITPGLDPDPGFGSPSVVQVLSRCIVRTPVDSGSRVLLSARPRRAHPTYLRCIKRSGFAQMPQNLIPAGVSKPH